MTTIPTKEEMLASVATLAKSSKAFSDTLPELVEKINSLAKEVDTLKAVGQSNYEALSEKLKDKTVEILNQYSQLKAQQEAEIASFNEGLEALKVEVNRVDERLGLIFPSMQANSESFRRSTEAYANSAELIQQHVKSLVTIDAVKVLFSELEKDLVCKKDIQDLKADLKEDVEQVKRNQGREFVVLLGTTIIGFLGIILALVWGVWQISPPTQPNEENPNSDSQSSSATKVACNLLYSIKS